MSTTTVYLVHENRVDEIASLKNSWGSGAFVWSALCERYFGDRSMWLCNPKDAQKLWDLVRDPRLTTYERIVLASTFDCPIIESVKFSEASRYFLEFEGQYYNGRGDCHLGTIARLLLRHHLAKTPCIGMCFQQTSVAESQWKRWDEDKDEPIPFSLETYRHFFVFKEFGTDK